MKSRSLVRVFGIVGALGVVTLGTGCRRSVQETGAGNPGAPLGAEVARAQAPRDGQPLDQPVEPNFGPQAPAGSPAGATGAAAPGATVTTDRGPFRFPVAGTATYDNGFGQGTHSRGGSPYNNGIDIMAAKGTPLVACVSGTLSKQSNGLGGLTVTIESEEGTRYYYAHLDSYAPGLTDGPIQIGAPVGTVGNTGNAAATAPHLHFCPVKNDQAWNPYEILKQSQAAAGGPA